MPADQGLCFRIIDSTIPLLPKSEISSLYPSSVAVYSWFVSDLVGHPKDRLSHDLAHITDTSLILRPTEGCALIKEIVSGELTHPGIKQMGSRLSKLSYGLTVKILNLCTQETLL